jgi:flagellar basal-body rod protein FlgB
MKLFDLTTIPTLSRALSAYALRHKTIAANVANAGTVGYVPKQVNFEEQLSSVAENQPGLRGVTSDPRHLPIGAESVTDAQPYVQDEKPSSGDPLASGANGVDIDQEMADLAKNQIRYKFAARLTGIAFQELDKSIRGTS